MSARAALAQSMSFCTVGAPLSPIAPTTSPFTLMGNPPEHALVLCCDEKSQIQALDRTQPGLPLKRGRAGTMTHDYKRNGTATLFAALNTFDGKVISLCQERHRHQEWLRFLRLVDDATPDHKPLHLIVDNYATHKHPAVQRWLKRHPRSIFTSHPPVLRGLTW
jgi:transposase